MDLITFDAFLASQETALTAVIKSCNATIANGDIRKVVEKHIGRTNRMLREILTFPTDLNSPSPADDDDVFGSPSTIKKPTSTSTKTPMKPGIIIGGVSTLFSRYSGSNNSLSARRGSRGGGRGRATRGGRGIKRQRVVSVSSESETDDSAGSLPETTNSQSMSPSRDRERHFVSGVSRQSSGPAFGSAKGKEKAVKDIYDISSSEDEIAAALGASMGKAGAMGGVKRSLFGGSKGREAALDECYFDRMDDELEEHGYGYGGRN